MKAVVMAGGEGSRLRPLTSRTPKPLVPIANKPVMQHIIELLRRHGITELVANVHYLADEIESYFGDGSNFGVSITYVVEDTPLGTAGAVKLAQPLLSDDFLVISGDVLTDCDISAIVERHRSQRNDATIGLMRVSNPLEFGVVITDDDGRISRFLEKPSWGEVFSDTINTGIYVLRPHVLDRMERGSVYDFSRDIFPPMLRDGERLGSYILQSYWTDVGNLQQYQQANYDTLAGHVETEHSGIEIEAGIWTGERCRIHPSAELTGPLQLGDDVQIGEGVTLEGPATIGDRTIIGDRAKIVRAVVWDDAYVGADSSLTDCTVADHDILKDHVVVGEGVVIGSRVTVGSSARIRPLLRIWPDKTISSGSIVSMSLVYGAKWPGSLFGGIGVSGLANLEITPEYASKLGEAFGSYLNPGATVAISRDGHPVSGLMCRSLVAGLMSTGINVVELNSYPLPLSRFATREIGEAGVHVRISPNDAQSVLFEFLDKNGINIDKATERKIENLFFREDFRRMPVDDVGIPTFPARTYERYESAFLKALAPTHLRERRFRIAIDYAGGSATLVLPRLLSKLGVDAIAINGYFGDERPIGSGGTENLEQLRGIVTSLKADLGVVLDPDAEAFTLVDDRGAVIGGSQLLVLLTSLAVSAYPNAKIAVPVTAPHAVEAVCEHHRATVVRTKSDRRTLMALAADPEAGITFAGGPNDEVIFPEMHSAFDGMYALAKTLELLAASGRKLSELNAELPHWHMAMRTVSCPWEHKGRIMRSLIDEQRNGHIQLLDGLRIEHDDGWVLILPDATDPAFKVFAEGGSEESASRYVETISERIEDLVKS
ncbi:MAG TPA: sugar phosphate nucleotidyltransferase [Candidatus Acidoferrales bacterium]|nr:sugar phosphate nucleotidyltransferase [Candidatus Acidoferrales bacterium]